MNAVVVKGGRALLLAALALAPGAGPAPARIDVAPPPRRPVRRVVSLAPSLTEIVFAIGAGDRLVGATKFCDFPPAARGVPRVGGMLDVSLETILRLDPDLVLSVDDSNRRETIEEIRGLGIGVASMRAAGWEGVLRQVVEVGALLGEDERAAALVAGLRGRADRVRRAVAGRPRPRVLYLVWADPAVVPGRGTVIDELLDIAGGESISRREPIPWPRYNLEQIIEARPEVILVARHASRREDAAIALWRKERLPLPAFEGGRVHVVDGDLVHRSGPRLIEGLELLARLVHPGALP